MRIRALSATAAAVLLATASTAAQSGTYKVPRTPWGEPDLQGTYNASDLQGVPMERAESLGTRDRLNDEEAGILAALLDKL